ncbi:MAG: ribosome small subunit-dependent GTPase A [Clostridia bacterium]|nr:ribosome small subunit-dependent GTPase A [Clostridia bacterium]
MTEKARIIKGVGGLYAAEIMGCGKACGEIINCRAKGSFRRDGIKPLPGDIIEFERQKDGTGFITSICERKNSLIRPASANIDLILFVVAAARPDPDLFLIDKMLAVASHNGIDVLMIVNKTDVDPQRARELCELYSLSGYDTVQFSAEFADDYAEKTQYIRDAVRGKVCFFAGASGVGKSSTINAVFPEFKLSLETGDLSEKIQRGKHTTRKTELFKLCEDSYIADTPGFSMLEIAQYNMIPKDCLTGAFPDLEKHSFSCRYTDCTHVCEDGCGVISAIEDGVVARSRHDSYKLLFEELKNKNEWD